MTKNEAIQVLQSIEDRAVDFPNMTAEDWVAIASAKRHLRNSLEAEEAEERRKDCPFRQEYCRYDGKAQECTGACSWVTDYLKRKAKHKEE